MKCFLVSEKVTDFIFLLKEQKLQIFSHFEILILPPFFKTSANFAQRLNSFVSPTASVTLCPLPLSSPPQKGGFPLKRCHDFERNSWKFVASAACSFLHLSFEGATFD
jgi:hypothetical protein